MPLVALAPLVALLGFLALRTLPASPFLLAGVIAIQSSSLAWMATVRLPAWSRLLLASCAACVAVTILVYNDSAADVLGFAVGGLCHALAYGTFLVWFSLSLRSGREPVVSGLARQMRKTMPNAVVRYTRKVTLAWCGFFAAQLLVSLLLLWLAPHGVWSAFVSVWNLPLVAAMALGEYCVRSCLFAREERTGFIATLIALRGIRVFPNHTS